MKRICILHTQPNINYKTDLELVRKLIDDDHKVLMMVNNSDEEFIFADKAGIHVRNIHFEAFKTSTEVDWLKSRFEVSRHHEKRGLVAYFDALINKIELKNVFKYHANASQAKTTPKKYKQTAFIKNLSKVRYILYLLTNFREIKHDEIIKSVLNNFIIFNSLNTKKLEQVKKIEENIDNKVYQNRAALAVRAFSPDTVFYFSALDQVIVKSIKAHLNQVQCIDLRKSPIGKSIFSKG